MTGRSVLMRADEELRKSRSRREPIARRNNAFRPCSQKAYQKKNEGFSTTPCLPWHFSPGDQIENCAVQFLAVCRIVHVDFKIHRVCHGFGVSDPLLLANRSQRSSAITSIRLDTERLSFALFFFLEASI